MRTLVVFTSPRSLARLRNNFDQRTDVSCLSDETKVLKFVEDEEIFVPRDAVSEDGLYLVWDRTEKERLREILSLNPHPEQVFFLRHGLPDEATIRDLNIMDRTERGTHDPLGTGEFYPEITQILSEPDYEKTNRVFDAVFPSFLPIKLEFLHECLIPENAPNPGKLSPERSKWKDVYMDFWILKENNGSPLTDPFDEKYINALELFRDALLES